MRNSSPRINATSCFEIKSGRQDTVRTFFATVLSICKHRNRWCAAMLRRYLRNLFAGSTCSSGRCGFAHRSEHRREFEVFFRGNVRSHIGTVLYCNPHPSSGADSATVDEPTPQHSSHVGPSYQGLDVGAYGLGKRHAIGGRDRLDQQRV